jgi:alpha-beta hydrolase superfamily lysophospholipase
MSPREGILESSDGVELFLRTWTPGVPPRAAVCLVHGLGEHSGRYGHVADTLTGAGYSVSAFDLRGHGASPGRRGHTPFPETFGDLDALLADASYRNPDVPCFLYGHSLGGLLVLSFLVQRRPPLAGAVAASPGLRSPLLEQRVKIGLSRVLGSAAPILTLPTGLDADGICRDPDVVAAYRADPLVHDRASMALARDGVVAAHRTSRSGALVGVPLLLLHGTADRLTYAEGTHDFAEQVTGDCSLILYDGLVHELHNEPERAGVLADIVAWLDAHSDPRDRSGPAV